MDEIKNYYGSEKMSSVSYLEFGQIDLEKSTKTVYSLKLHNRAYDWFMLARYTNDILALRNIQRHLSYDNIDSACDCFSNEVHHNNELCLGLGKLACLSATQKTTPIFFEIGSTLFGCIDSMKTCLEFFKDHSIYVNLSDVLYAGLDISDMFNELAKVYYGKEHKIITSKSMEQLPSKYDVFYSKGVTLLYAIRSLDELFAYIDNSEIAYFDYAFSLGNDKDLVIGTGKTGRYFSLKSFLDRSKFQAKHVYVNSSTSRIEKEKGKICLEFFVGEDKYFSHFLNYERKIYNTLKTKKLKADIFLKEYHNSWIKFENFLQSVQV